MVTTKLAPPHDPLITSFREHLLRLGKAKATVANYVYAVQRFGASIGSNWGTVSEDLVRDYFRGIKGSGSKALSASAIKHFLEFLKDNPSTPASLLHAPFKLAAPARPNRSAIPHLQQYEEHLLLRRNRSPNTVSGYLSDVRLFYLDQLAGRGSWKAVDRQMVTAYLKKLKQSHRDTSISRKVYALKGFFKYLKREGYVKDNPFEDIEFNRLQRSLPTFLSVEETGKLLDHIRQPLPSLQGLPLTRVYLTFRDRAMLEVTYSAALRVSELVGLNGEDIDWEGCQIRVIGKGRKERMAPLGSHAIAALKDYSKHYPEKWGKELSGKQPAFLSHLGRRILTRSIHRMLRKWSKAAGITKRITPHSLRHSAATHMVDNGADLLAIKELLGHANVATTQIYVHMATRRIREIHSNTHPRA